MTKEEALSFAQKELQAAYERADKIKIKDKTRYIEVLEMVIQVLSQESINEIVQKAYKDGKKDGYVQAKIEQESCEDAVSREFVELVVEYPPADLCTYPEYKGKPYYSIKYRENGAGEFVGYGTYKPEVLSQYLKEDFIPSITRQTDDNKKIARLHQELADVYRQLECQTGKWILLDECANSGYYCSRCQKKLVKEGWSETVKKIKFCPNCGAKMVESQESENKK